MKSSKWIIAAAAVISVFGAATSAYAQNNSTDSGQRQGTTPQTEAQMQSQGTSTNQGSTNRLSTDSSMNRNDGSGATGMDNRTNSRSVNTERAARADRN